MFFWLKKLIGYWIMPVPACVVLLAVGVLLLFTTKHRRTGRVLVTAAALILLLLGNRWISQSLIRSIEATYPPIPELTASNAVPPALAACRFVVVLGAGNGNSPGLSALNRLSNSARARIAEAVRLLRKVPEAQMLVSGPAEGQQVTHATVLERAAVSLGIDPARIQRIEHARDTEDESLAVKRRVGDAPFALVTSAWHMPRAAALFRAAGMSPLLCPTDFLAQSDGSFHWRDLLWDVESLERSSLALRERAGYLWISLRGKSQPARPPG